MPRYFVAPSAERDIEEILRWSHERFGEEARIRYEALLVCAIRDVADNPDRPGSQQRPEIVEGARTYHLRHSHSHVEIVGRVKRPRHILLFRVRPDRQIEIGRVLHESMDLARHLPDEYRPMASGDE